MSFSPKHRVVGMILAIALSAAVPAALAQTREIQRIIQTDSSGSYLGIQMDDVTSSNMSRYKLNAERGVIVRSVMKGSPAETANLKQDDVLLEFGGFQVWSASQLSRLVQDTPPGRKVELAVSRDGKRMNLTAEIGSREARQADNRMETLPRELPEGRFFQFFPNLPQQRPDQSPERKPRLGVTLQPVTDQLGEFLGVPGGKGALVASVASGSASAGKLKSGDVIIGVDGKNINDPEELSRTIREKPEGKVTLKVIRDKKEIAVVVNLPSDEGEGKGYKL
jgi:serine protease Do